MSMPRPRILLLSGPVASGKTELANALRDRYELRGFKTRDLIQELTGTKIERSSLQKAGESLDRKHKGKWVAKALARALENQDDDRSVFVDAVRIKAQVEAVRDSFGSSVVHVHLTAPPEILAERYARRAGEIEELPSYESVRANPTEAAIDTLRDPADIVIDTSRCSANDVVVRVAAQVGLYGRIVDRLVDVVIGGGFGSEGKGHVVSHLAPEYDFLLRVGGPNAGHTVYEEPKPYTFHHLPSGTRRCPEKKLILCPGSLLYIPNLLAEMAQCAITPDRLFIDPQAMVIEDADIENEAGHLVNTVASTGRGVGSAASRKVLRTLAVPAVRLAKDVPELEPFIRETLPLLESAFADGKRILVEGTQGTGLSIHHGHYPYVTSRETSVSGCLAEAGIAPSRVRRIVMVCRTYPIRVEDPSGGTSGPMGIDITWQTVSERSGVSLAELRTVERTSTTNRKRRVAEFDWCLLRKAASINGPTDIALTFADYINIENRGARRFEQLTEDTLMLIQEIERVAAAPVSLIATRFHSRSIIDRRAW